jgi:hypothetical protein
MKTITKTIVYLQMAALCLTTVLAGPAGASSELPFHGKVTQIETVFIDFPAMLVQGTGTGQATKLGHFTETFEHHVNLLTGEGIGFAQFNAANGDSILTEIVPVAGPTPSTVTEYHTIVGGTGRFEGATGSFTLVRFLTSVNDMNFSDGSFDGTIVLSHGK